MRTKANSSGIAEPAHDTSFREACHPFLGMDPIYPHALVYLVLTMLYGQCYEDREKHHRTTSLSEVLSRMRQDHHREVLPAACEEVAAGASVNEVVARYLKEPLAAA